eukprot:g818.t1
MGSTFSGQQTTFNMDDLDSDDSDFDRDLLDDNNPRKSYFGKCSITFEEEEEEEREAQVEEISDLRSKIRKFAREETSPYSEIFIKTMNGKSFKIANEIFPSDTIADVKRIIESHLNIKTFQQKLILNGKVLGRENFKGERNEDKCDYDSTVGLYLSEGSIIHLITIQDSVATIKTKEELYDLAKQLYSEVMKYEDEKKKKMNENSLWNEEEDDSW